MEQLDILKHYRSDAKQNTSLITLICPPNIEMKDLRELIKHECATAINIKGNSNRKSVISALGKIKTVISSFKTLPGTGIAIFAGEYI